MKLKRERCRGQDKASIDRPGGPQRQLASWASTRIFSWELSDTAPVGVLYAGNKRRSYPNAMDEISPPKVKLLPTGSSYGLQESSHKIIITQKELEWSAKTP